jgi:hypothetical protein
MEEGFVLDEGYGYRYVARWVEGAPERNGWIGIRLRKRRLIEAKTWRCTACGYLESYAR